MEKPAWRLESVTSRRQHTRLQLCKRCVAAARQKTGSDSFLSSLLGVGFWRERRNDLFKLRIAPQWFPQRMKFETRVVNVTRYRHEFLKHFDRAIVFTAPGINLSEAFEHQRTIIDVFRDGHQIDSVLCLLQGQFFLAQSRIDLSKDRNRPRMFRFDDQSLRQNFSTFAKRSHRTR